MDSNEAKLEQVVQKIDEYEVPRVIPIFEIYATLVALGLAIVLFMNPTLLYDGGELYATMLKIVPQFTWALVFTIAGAAGVVGLLANSNALRIFALVVLSIVYGAMAVCYGVTFPNIGTIVISGITVFSIMSIPLVKYTGMKNDKLTINNEGNDII